MRKYPELNSDWLNTMVYDSSTGEDWEPTAQNYQESIDVLYDNEQISTDTFLIIKHLIMLTDSVNKLRESSLVDKELWED